jgi:hypothetical protein
MFLTAKPAHLPRRAVPGKSAKKNYQALASFVFFAVLPDFNANGSNKRM